MINAEQARKFKVPITNENYTERVFCFIEAAARNGGNQVGINLNIESREVIEKLKELGFQVNSCSQNGRSFSVTW